MKWMNREGEGKGEQGEWSRGERGIAWRIEELQYENDKGDDNVGAATRGQQPDGNGNEEETG